MKMTSNSLLICETLEEVPMKYILLMLAFMLTNAVEAGNESTPEKKSIINDQKAFTGLKAVGSAVGTGLALYSAYKYIDRHSQVYYDLQDNIRKGTQSTVDFLKMGGAAAGTGIYLYTAHILGSKALALARSVRAEEAPNSEKKAVPSEHMVLTALKCAGAVVGIGFGVGFTVGCGVALSLSKQLDEVAFLHAISLCCGTYSTYTLGYEVLPYYIHRIRAQ